MPWVDIGCDDFAGAARNRVMVKMKRNIFAYLQVEAIVRGWSFRKPLPAWIPMGHIPTVGKKEYSRLYGYHEI